MWAGIFEPVKDPNIEPKDKRLLDLDIGSSNVRTYTISVSDSQEFELRLEFTSLCFLGLQFIDGKLQSFSAFIIMWANSF